MALEVAVSQHPNAELAVKIKALARALGFQQLGITDTDLRLADARLAAWVADGRHGEMHYMHKHGSKRTVPAELVPGTVRVLTARMDYFPPETQAAWGQLENPEAAYISRYALGRDYHKVLRMRLQTLSDQIAALIGPFGYRVFVDSAPVMEKPLAEKAGLGWIGKHTNLINSQAGSYFFLGEIYVDFDLEMDLPASEHCGSCTRCISACPTGAITAPFQLDARLCISYLTIELDGAIPIALRRAIGNRIYGCDDCQLVCPWNKFAQLSAEPDFRARHQLDRASLLELFAWTEPEFLKNTEGSAIRRIGYARWQRNLAVALGNAPESIAVQAVLSARLANCTDQNLAEHLRWALQQQKRSQIGSEYS